VIAWREFACHSDQYFVTMTDGGPLTSIFHYTDLAGAIAILSNGTLRATHAEFMNDMRQLAFKQELWGRISHLEPSDDEQWDPDHSWPEAVGAPRQRSMGMTTPCGCLAFYDSRR